MRRRQLLFVCLVGDATESPHGVSGLWGMGFSVCTHWCVGCFNVRCEAFIGAWVTFILESESSWNPIMHSYLCTGGWSPISRAVADGEHRPMMWWCFGAKTMSM